MVYPPDTIEIRAVDVIVRQVIIKDPSPKTVTREAKKIMKLKPGDRALRCVEICHRWPLLWQKILKEEQKLKYAQNRQARKKAKQGGDSRAGRKAKGKRTGRKAKKDLEAKKGLEEYPETPKKSKAKKHRKEKTHSEPSSIKSEEQLPQA